MEVNRKNPSVIQLPGGHKLKATLLRVTSSNDDGSPRTFELIRDDEKVNLTEGREFWVVYAPDDLRNPRN